MPLRKLFIYKVTQRENTVIGAVQEMIVVAPTAQEARKMHPLQQLTRNREAAWEDPAANSFWCSSPNKVQATILGTANNRQRISYVVSPRITLNNLLERKMNNV